ncbi:hypothetical protein QNH98_03440 [Myroides sp. mNGS23_01]|nr:hypothetical protein [Myroides sp. mNGS23_01]WHT39750.1 hypothetical protein QNH98_03440 [Myroides sp. mNGS23_01]
MKKYVYIIPLALVFTACKVGKDYERPALDTPNQFYVNPQVDSSANTMAELSWQNFLVRRS